LFLGVEDTSLECKKHNTTVIEEIFTQSVKQALRKSNPTDPFREVLLMKVAGRNASGWNSMHLPVALLSRMLTLAGCA
jgi:hypothetical protein